MLSPAAKHITKSKLAVERPDINSLLVDLCSKNNIKSFFPQFRWPQGNLPFTRRALQLQQNPRMLGSKSGFAGSESSSRAALNLRTAVSAHKHKHSLNILASDRLL